MTRNGSIGARNRSKFTANGAVPSHSSTGISQNQAGARRNRRVKAPASATTASAQNPRMLAHESTREPSTAFRFERPRWSSSRSRAVFHADAAGTDAGCARM
jgi:hypothetical protein